MIEAEKAFSIAAPINDVWDYVQDIEKWAMLLPGCRECTIIDEFNSRWTIKVGAGGLIKTVNVLVNVESWDGPDTVNFTYKLESEPVVGSGRYFASTGENNATDIRLHLRVEGSGPMAPMWEAVCKPLFHPLASSFTEKLKGEIEQYVGIAPAPAKKGSIFSALAAFFRKLFSLFGGSNQAADLSAKKKADVSESN